MTLRDQFAAAALQGYCSHPDAGAWSHEHTALAAYQQADAMIAEREKNLSENTQSIKQALVDAINARHSGINPSVNLSAEHLIQQLITGVPF